MASLRPIPDAPAEVEFLLDYSDDDGRRVGSTLIACGLEFPGQVVVPRVIGGKPAVTLWLNVADAAEDLGADHVNYRHPVVVTRLKDLAGSPTASAAGRGEQAG